MVVDMWRSCMASSFTDTTGHCIAVQLFNPATLGCIYNPLSPLKMVKNSVVTARMTPLHLPIIPISLIDLLIEADEIPVATNYTNLPFGIYCRPRLLAILLAAVSMSRVIRWSSQSGPRPRWLGKVISGSRGQEVREVSGLTNIVVTLQNLMQGKNDNYELTCSCQFSREMFILRALHTLHCSRHG